MAAVVVVETAVAVAGLPEAGMVFVEREPAEELEGHRAADIHRPVADMDYSQAAEEEVGPQVVAADNVAVVASAAS